MNWYVIFLIVVAIVVIAGDIYMFTKLSPEEKQKKLEEQKLKVQEWLIWAVAQAESDLGGGTGQLKLRKVYGMFIVAFPWLVETIPFEEFSDMVDVALDKFRDMLKNNSKVKEYVESGKS